MLSSRFPLRNWIVVLGALLVLGACGARTPAGSARGRDDGGSPRDFTVDRPNVRPDVGPPDFSFPRPDFSFPRPDFSFPRDLPFPPDFFDPDFAFPRPDFGPPDFGFPGTDGGIPGCLPVHPSALVGVYKGKWNGTAQIGGGGGGSGFPVSGTLDFVVTPMPGAPPGVFQVKGSLRGVPVINTMAVDGTLNCRDLRLQVRSSGIPAKGDLSGTLDNLSPLGFNKGQLFVSASFGGFIAEAKGSWSAYK